MKAHIHPPYRTVVFHDTSANEYFKVGSTIRTDRVIELDGETFPYVTIDVSSKSHPYYTGKQKTFANEGSAARFRQRFGNEGVIGMRQAVTGAEESHAAGFRCDAGRACAREGQFNGNGAIARCIHQHASLR